MKYLYGFITILLAITIITHVVLFPYGEPIYLENLVTSLRELESVPKLYNKDDGFFKNGINVLTYPYQFISWFINTAYSIGVALTGIEVMDEIFAQ